MTDDLDAELAALRAGYLTDRARDVITMRDCMTVGRFGDLKILAHRMKGTGGTYAAHELSRLGAALGAAAEQGDTDAITRVLDEAERWLANAREPHTDPGDSE